VCKYGASRVVTPRTSCSKQVLDGSSAFFLPDPGSLGGEVLLLAQFRFGVVLEDGAKIPLLKARSLEDGYRIPECGWVCYTLTLPHSQNHVYDHVAQIFVLSTSCLYSFTLHALIDRVVSSARDYHSYSTRYFLYKR
jgi:hypothetical protein